MKAMRAIRARGVAVTAHSWNQWRSGVAGQWRRVSPHVHVARHIMRERWRSLWLRAHPAQAIAEALVAQTLALVWGILVVPEQFAPRERVVYAGPIILIVFISGVASLLWAAFRMRRARVWWHGLLINIVSATVLAVVPTIILTLLLQSLLSSTSRANVRLLETSQSPIAFLITRFTIAWIVVLSLAFLFVRVGISQLIWWNQLRRRSLVWALTNAHLLVVVLGAGVFCTFIVLANVYVSHSIEPQILPILVVFSILTVIAVLVVLPPSALFSYIFARRTTRRLRTLATATNVLREGDYSVRVPVEGADEVAQLQENFNAMAVDLASAVDDLKVERDTVSQLLEARRELVASVSHELRTPVSTLRSYLESSIANWSKTDAPPASLRHDLDIMERETRRLQTLIEDLFTLARAEVSKLDLRCVPTDVGEEVRRIVETVAPVAWQSGRVEVVAEVAPHLPLALVDGIRLNQVLQNLLHNGIRHTPPGGIVAISAAADGEHIILQVRDTGDGIASDDLPHIWKRFYRSDSARMQSASGSGLGLALVKELTEAMGGSVAIESTVGEGSCFTITVPRATTSGTPMHASPGTSSTRHVKPATQPAPKAPTLAKTGRHSTMLT
ncbi:MAG TPA: ATP-binding protein [Ktedonobacterales bacterium]|nr:ATP-binding protein [Ktedonobacterales bacterium]